MDRKKLILFRIIGRTLIIIIIVLFYFASSLIEVTVRYLITSPFS